MGIFTIGVTLFVGLILVLVISSLISRSRSNTGSYHHHEDGLHHAGYVSNPEHAQTTSQDSDASGGRDMSHDHHSHTHSGDGGHGGGGDAGGHSSGSGGE